MMTNVTTSKFSKKGVFSSVVPLPEIIVVKATTTRLN